MPPNGSTGFARSRVSTSIRDPCPPACTSASTSPRRMRGTLRVAAGPAPQHGQLAVLDVEGGGRQGRRGEQVVGLGRVATDGTGGVVVR